MHIVCPRCGAKSSEKEFMDAFCADCYELKLKLPKPTDFNITKCKKCGKMLLKGEWQKFSESKIAEAVGAKCKGGFDEVFYDFGSSTLNFLLKKGETEKTISKRFELNIGVGICPDCSRMSGGYYEAIIQIRGDNQERIRQYANSLEKRLSEKTFVSKVEEKKEGIDLYVGSSKAVLEDFRNRGTKAVMSSKLAGRKEGRRIYRTTFLVRLYSDPHKSAHSIAIHRR